MNTYPDSREWLAQCCHRRWHYLACQQWANLILAVGYTLGQRRLIVRGGFCWLISNCQRWRITNLTLLVELLALVQCWPKVENPILTLPTIDNVGPTSPCYL